MVKLLRNYFPLLLILLLAAFLRLYRISEYMTFLGDEGRDMLVVYNILHGKLTLLGPTASVGGFFMGPFYYYLITPFLFLSAYNPVGPAIMVALFSLATILLMYKIGRDFFTAEVGLIATFFYAIAPVVIVYSRASWNPNVMPFFSLLTMYILYEAVKRKSMKLFLLCGIFYGFDVQLHYTELFMGAAMILYIILMQTILAGESMMQKTSHVIKKGMVLFIGFLLGLSPFLAFEIRHDFLNIKNISSFIFASGETGAGANFLFNVWDSFFRVFARLVGNYPSKDDIHFYGNTELVVMQIFLTLVALVSTAILLWQYKKTFAKHNQAFAKYSLLIIWFFITLLCFGIYKKPVYDYYYESIFPLTFLFTANALYFFWKKKGISAIAAVGVFLLLAYSNLSRLPISYAPNNQVGQMERIAKVVAEKTDGKPFNFALVAQGNSDHAYRYFLTLWGYNSTTIENPQNDPKRTTVTKQLLVICEKSPCLPLGNPLWEIAGFGEASIAGHWVVPHAEIYRLIHPTK